MFSIRNKPRLYLCMIRMCQVMETKLDDKFFGFPFDRNIDFNIYDERYIKRKLLMFDFIKIKHFSIFLLVL